jgi:UrcA family protein
METKITFPRAHSSLSAAAVACMLFAGSVMGNDKDHTVIVSLHVSAEGLDLSQPADARRFYTRLENAAWVVCTHGNRVGLEPVDNPTGCRQKALGNAIHSVKAPLLTQIYLESHTLREAAAQGIDVPAQVAAK